MKFNSFQRGIKMLKHKMFGPVEVTPETKSLDRRFANDLSKTGSMFVVCKGEIKQVSKDMIVASN